MFVGSAPSELKLGTTTVTGVRRGAGLIYDSDVAAFQKSSGATQVGPILALVDYLKAESLWDYARFYPMKSAQNAGSGSTVYGLGGLTSNNMTLYNSPTWGSGGLTFDAGSSQRGATADFLSNENVAAFWRGNAASSGSNSQFLSHYNTASQRAWLIGKDNSDSCRQIRSSDGSTTHIAVGGTVTGEKTFVSTFYNGEVMRLYDSKNEVTLGTIGGSPLTVTHNSTSTINVMALLINGSPGDYSSGTVAIAGVIETALTTAQREAITDLINAL